MPKLTKRVVDSLVPPPPGREAYSWDTELRGFGIRLMSSGVGSYVLKYRNREGRQRKLAIGRVGALTPDEARSLARKAMAEIAGGRDPSAERRAIQAAITVSELCDLYLEDATQRIKASTVEGDRSRIESHVKPLIGSRSVAGLTTADIERLQTDIAAGKSSKQRKPDRGGAVTGGRGVASRTVGMIGTILEFARKRGLIAANPAREVARIPEGKQERYLIEEEITQLGATLSMMEGELGSHVGLNAIRFLLVGGFRREECLALPLSWLDQEANCARLRDSKGVKGLAGGSRIRVRPLGDAAFRIIEAVERVPVSI